MGCGQRGRREDTALNKERALSAGTVTAVSAALKLDKGGAGLAEPFLPIAQVGATSRGQDPRDVPKPGRLGALPPSS